MRISSSAKWRTQRLTMAAMLASAALMISYAEHLIPPVTAIPGIKPGFANVAVTAAFALSPSAAFGVSFVRVCLFALLFGTPVSFAMSASGAVLSYIFLLVMYYVKPRRMSFVGLSVLSAFCHNTGQLICAAVLTGSVYTLYYLPVLAMSSVICGTLSGILMNYVYPFVVKYTDKIKLK